MPEKHKHKRTFCAVLLSENLALFGTLEPFNNLREDTPTLYLAENKRVSGALRLPQCPAQLTTYETQSSLLVAAGALSFTAAGGLL